MVSWAWALKALEDLGNSTMSLYLLRIVNTYPDHPASSNNSNIAGLAGGSLAVLGGLYE